MTASEFDELLRKTLADRQLSRSERHALRAVLEEAPPDEATLALYRSRAFALARESVTDPRSREVMEWLEDVVKALLPGGPRRATSTLAEAWFSPGEEPLLALSQLLGDARRSVEVCVFTITDDRIAEQLIAAHRRGVAVRIVTDGEKALDAGSDIWRLQEAGIPVRVDRERAHMHHKFALFDRARLATGSYNWTRSAAMENQENLLVCDDPRLVLPFCRTFDALWSALG